MFFFIRKLAYYQIRVFYVSFAEKMDTTDVEKIVSINFIILTKSTLRYVSCCKQMNERLNAYFIGARLI